MSEILKKVCIACISVAFAACAGNDASVASTAATTSYPGLQRIVDAAGSPTVDVFEVFVCAVPRSTSDPIYVPDGLRLDLDPDVLAGEFDEHVGEYFETLSHGAYRPHFIPGATVTFAAAQNHDACVAEAVTSASTAASAVIVIANAEHLSTEPGGWGRPGVACRDPFCPASSTGRAVYIGGADFRPALAAAPPLDLLEHEIGHTLDLPHSGSGGGDQYNSALDLMSNSAAPRDFQPMRIHGQDVLAIDRLSLKWLPAAAMAVAAPGGGSFDLSPASADDGLRLLVLPVAADTFVTVEYVRADGLDDFLPESGIAVHRIDQSPAACGRPAEDARPCAGYERAQITLGGPPPHLDLLGSGEGPWVVDGWSITADPSNSTSGATDAATFEVEVRPTGG